jgi:uncharacterized protein YdeI (YjbR/CyaY-like superfamily)
MSTLAGIMVLMDMVFARDVAEWREWLAANGESAAEVWLVIQHKDSETPSIRHHEAVEQALCFGWIDGLQRRHDATSAQQRFSPRRAGSRWSAVNRERAARLTALGLMTPAGQAMIDLAKETGGWEIVIPADIRGALEADVRFRALAPSSRRLTLEWVATAKRPETRQRRLEQAIKRLG